MIKMKIFKLLIVFTIILSSCDSDDNDINTHELIGVWLRSDASEEEIYKLYFGADNNGIWSSITNNPDGTVIGAAEIFTWNIDSTKNLVIEEMDLNTPYYINTKGQLILSNLTDLPFNKID